MLTKIRIGPFMRPLTARHQSSTSQDTKIPGTEYEAPTYKGPSVEWIKQVKKERLNPSLVTHFRNPLLLHAGRMQYLFDVDNKKYLDLFGGIATVSVGHCHPKVCEAAEKQIRTVWHTSNIYLHPKIHEYAHRLTEKLPGNLKVVYFMNSGSEANDFAITLARQFTNALDVIAFQNAYHGGSPPTQALCGLSNWKPSLVNSANIHHIPNADPYNGVWGGHRDSVVQSLRASESEVVNGVCSSADKYLTFLKNTLEYSIPGGRPAAFFAESIQGVGGVQQYPLGFLKKAFQLIRERGGLCISDEVQTGFGRTGEHFWGFQGHGVIPDIVTMAKGIGNGFPLAAVVTTPTIAQTLNTILHFNTFGGNPLACAVGLSVLEAIEEDETQKNCQELGTYCLKELQKFRDEHEIVGDVRGKGLMIGVELVREKESRIPLDAEIVGDIYEGCKNDGVLFGRGGRYGNILRILPPMCVRKEDLEFSLSVFKDNLCKLNL